MIKIFISYRQSDSRGDSRQLYERLAESFGAENVFFDVSKLELGDDWLAIVKEKVRSSDILLAVIGENWLQTKNDTGGLRLHDADDPVRVEIAAALAQAIRVIPVLLHRAQLPRASELPANIKKLSNAVVHEIRHRSFDRDVDDLIEQLGGSVVADHVDKPASGDDFWSSVAKGFGKKLGEAIGNRVANPAPVFPRQTAPVRQIPQPTPAPMAPSIPNLAGQWGSNFGLAHFIQQSGNTIAVQAIDAFGRTAMQGQGTIMGGLVEIGYTSYMPPFPSQGRARLEITPDGRFLRGSALNLASGMTTYIELFR